MEREVYCQDEGRTRLWFGLGKPKKSGKVKDESRFRESEPEQTGCKVERKGEMSEAKVFVGRAWNASRTATGVRADKKSRRKHLMSGQGVK